MNKSRAFAKAFTFGAVGYALVLIISGILGSFPSAYGAGYLLATFLIPSVATGLIAGSGWSWVKVGVLFHTDEEGTKYYYHENSVVAIGDARSAKYIGVYSTPKSNNYTYGYVVDAQVKCGLIFYKFKIMSMQSFGEGGPDDLQFNPTPPDDGFRRASKGSPVYYLSQAMWKAE